VEHTGALSLEDLIADEEMVITVSHTGYIKRIPVDTYRRQARGGRGISGMNTKEEDWVEHLFLASTHDYLMFFTRQGQCYWLKVHQIPQGGRNSRGKPIVNLLNVDREERIAALVPVREFSEDRYLLFSTRRGVIKKTALSAYGNVRTVGLNAININEGDELIDVALTDGDHDVVLATREGLAIRFHESDVREMGRPTTGVRGVSLGKEDVVVGMVVLDEATTLLVVTERGMGKRTEIDEYRRQRRGGQGRDQHPHLEADRPRGGDQGDRARRRADDHHPPGDREPPGRGRHPGDRPEHAGRAADPALAPRHGDRRGAHRLRGRDARGRCGGRGVGPMIDHPGQAGRAGMSRFHATCRRMGQASNPPSAPGIVPWSRICMQ
jgi:DNA gyrase/topoisomerase IV subunit A